jgi:serine/threonine protein kinase
LTSPKVAVKVVRANNENENGHEKMNKACRLRSKPSSVVADSLLQRLRKELLVWHKLDHENILPLLGITFDFGRGNPMGMVCPWVENGNLNGYLVRQEALAEADRFRIVSSE